MAMNVLDEIFIADIKGPPKRRMYLFRDPPAMASHQTRGWCFVVEDILVDGSVTPVWDTWEELFAEIVRYPAEYATGAYIWRRQNSGEQVTLGDLSRHFA